MTGNLANREVKPCGEQFASHFHANIIDVTWKGFAGGIIVQQCIQTVTTDTEAVHHIRTHQVDIGIEPFSTNG